MRMCCNRVDKNWVSLHKYYLINTKSYFATFYLSYLLAGTEGFPYPVPGYWGSSHGIQSIQRGTWCFLSFQRGSCRRASTWSVRLLHMPWSKHQHFLHAHRCRLPQSCWDAPKSHTRFFPCQSRSKTGHIADIFNLFRVWSFLPLNVSSINAK